MPNIESAIKRARQNETTNARNSAKIASVRTAVKRFEQAAAEDADNKDELFRNASKMLDQAASKGLIHANKAAREKARLAKKA